MKLKPRPLSQLDCSYSFEMYEWHGAIIEMVGSVTDDSQASRWILVFKLVYRFSFMICMEIVPRS